MTSATQPTPVAALAGDRDLRLPLGAALVAFGALFAPTLAGLAREWWTSPDAGHGLLLAPLAIWLGYRSGLDRTSRPAPWWGLLVLLGSVLLRFAGALAVEQFSQRVALLGGLMGLTLFFFGWRQLLRWWLPAALLVLSIPLPAIVLNQLALPLQLQASRMGAALLEWRQIPVRLAGNVILLPGHQLFVTEACSGLRSLTALLSLGLLMGALWLRSPVLRALLIVAAVVMAVLVNAVRVFLTGFFVYFISPEMGQGFLHLSEGWLLFVVSLAVLGGVTWLARGLEQRLGWGTRTGAAHG
jgi:exosortase